MTKTIALLHPGMMGVAVAAALKTSAANVIWASENRSEETKKRAQQAGLRDVLNLKSIVAQSEIIVSVCPPASAIQLAESIAELGFTGSYVDANAIAPSTALEVAGIVTSAGASFIDGSILGGPPKEKNATRIYFSGADANSITELFEASLFQAITLEGEQTAASALKMAFAAWTKGSTALLLNVRALAKSTGVEDALLNEWSISLPELEKRSDRNAFIGSQKAWRFVGEMQEIAKTFDRADLPDGFHQAASNVYERLSSFKGSENHTTQDVLKKLLEPE